MNRRATHFLRYLLAAVLLAAAPQANACQLVCVIAPGTLNDAGCNAFKAGFKVAQQGMLASLPAKGPEFFGPNASLKGGIDCGQISAYSAMQVPFVSDGSGPQATTAPLTGQCGGSCPPTSTPQFSSVGGGGGGTTAGRGGSFTTVDLTTACNARYNAGNASTVCCNM